MRVGEPVTGIDIDLVEYERLKEEQLGRIGVRDNLVYATLAVYGGVAAIVLGGGAGRLPALLLLPPACLVLGWTYLVNDQKVSAISRYLRRGLGPQLAAATGREMLGWETEHRSDGARRRRKIAQVTIDVLLFCWSGVGAVVIFWASATRVSWPLRGVSIVEVTALVLLAVEILRNAEISGSA
ncbi:hypothetical protein ND748_04975 [Frankia sp. AiPs1]|uniref:hypothetical protein n=1 Tax=Frankia sp. AiPs1 TaxID=573493 RepID=UPI00204384A5|nr:hypothetical protein [Frankia sp. AiPs1]MCM3921030.1 hypothetical protein [Frankia sp. AiPs1]